MKTARSTMMSPRDKMHVIELLVAKEHLYIHLKGIFQCIIMLCNQNERQRQSKQMFCVCVTMICRKWSPRDNILFMIILHPQTDISGYQQLRRQYKRQYLWSKVKKYIFLSLDVLKTYFSTMFPRNRYDHSMELKKIQNAPKYIFMQHNMSLGDTYVLHDRFFVIQIKIINVIVRCIKYLSRGDIEIFGRRHRKFVRGAIRWPVVFF